MFDVVRNNPKIAQIFLVLISVPFALFGIDYYFRNGAAGGDAVATIGKQEISQVEFTNTLRQQVDAMRQQQGDAFDRSIADSPEFKKSVLNSMIDERLLDTAIKDGHLYISDSYVQELIKSIPDFQENGQFSRRLYDLVLERQGKSAQMFEYEMRARLQRTALNYSVVNSFKQPASTAMRWLGLMDEQRTVSTWRLDAKSRIADVKLAADAAKKFYDAHQNLFQEPERVKVEYLVLSADDLAAQNKVSEEDARKWYEDYKKTDDGKKDARFAVTEKRHASHILIAVPEGAKADVKAAAKKKAEDLLAKVKADPSKFAALAKEFSDDKASAVNGGDLGAVEHGAFVPSVDDALFKLKPKEISGVVESNFGYHIIVLHDIQAGGFKSFDEAKKDAMDELRHQAGAKRYAELGEQFGSMVYEQPDGLKPIAEKLGLTLQTTDWVSAATLPQGVLTNPKVRAVIFSADAIKEKRNSEAIDLGKNTVVSVRVVDSKAARTKTFDEVKADAENFAKLEEAAKQTKADGEAALAKLKAGTAVEIKWSDAQSVKRFGQLSVEARKAVFGQSAQKLPAYVGVADEGGYTVYRIEKVEAEKTDPNNPALKQVADGYASALGSEDLRAYLKVLRARYKVTINENKLNSKADQQQ